MWGDENADGGRGKPIEIVGSAMLGPRKLRRMAGQ